MRIVVALFLIVPVILSADTTDFRNVRWGMAIDEVRRVEDGELQNEDSATLEYAAIMGGLTCRVSYRFSVVGLSSVEARFESSLAGENGFVPDYSALKDRLTKRYGAPTFDTVAWRSEGARLTNEDNSWTAVQMGRVTYQAKWETTRSLIELRLYAPESYDVWHVLRYRGVGYHQEGDDGF